MAWCSTATYSDGSHVADVGAWGECADTCAACQVRERHVVTRMIMLPRWCQDLLLARHVCFPSPGGKQCPPIVRNVTPRPLSQRRDLHQLRPLAVGRGGGGAALVLHPH